MKTDEIEIFLIGTVVSTFVLTLSMYLGKHIFNFLKMLDLSRLKPSPQNFKAAASEAENRRRKIEIKPGIICTFPIFQESRPEAPLS